MVAKPRGVQSSTNRKPRLRRQLQGDWVELESVDGEVYYANVATKETTWEMPVFLAEQESKENATASTSPAAENGAKCDTRSALTSAMNSANRKASDSRGGVNESKV